MIIQINSRSMNSMSMLILRVRSLGPSLLLGNRDEAE
jgi:hypothetical protein